MPVSLVLSRQPLRSRPLQDWLDEPEDRVVLVTTPAAVAGAEDVLARRFPRHRLVDDYRSWSAELAADEAARAHGVGLVASTSESDVLRSARLRERLGLPGQGLASALAYRDKVVMKRLAAAAGIAVPAFAPVDGAADLLDLVDRYGLPVVVKPRLGAGAEGVSILREPADVAAFLAAGPRPDAPRVPGQWMAETFVAGDFFHVDGIMRAGRVVHAWPSRYLGALAERMREHGTLAGVLLDRDDPQRKVLADATADIVAALPAAPLPLAFHLELWIGADGTPVLCEIACRAGGGPVAETYERAFGVQLAREGLRAQCGSALRLDHQPAAPRAAYGWLLLPPGHGIFVPPAEPCPVPGAELTILTAPGTTRAGVEHVTDGVAKVIASAGSAAGVRAVLDEAADWWTERTRWR